MAVMKRSGVFYLYFRPFKDKKIGLKLDVQSKTEAKAVEVMILRACRTGDYSTLDPMTREACGRMFDNQGWEMPPELGGGTAPKQELTLWHACQIFLRYPEVKACKAHSRYEACIIHLVEKLGRETPVKRLWVPNLKSYQITRVNEGASPGTVNWELATLSKLYQTLIELQFLEANPCRLLKRLSEKSGERQVYIASKDVQLIAAHCPAWYAAIVWTAFYTGMRRGEILGLTWKGVNLTKRIIRLAPMQTKEANWKRVPIREELLPIFEACMKVRSLETDKVFLIDGHPPSSESMKNPWRKACKAIGLDNPRPRLHDLRHSWRANARRSGMDPVIAESIMGHWYRERSVNERYGRLSDPELLKAIDAMSFDHGETEILVTSRNMAGSGKKNGNKMETRAGSKENQEAAC